MIYGLLGVFCEGPLVPPSAPLTPVASCDGCVAGSIFPLPLVPDDAPVEDALSEGFIAGPFVLPGAP